MSFDPDLKDLTATLVKYFMISPLFAFADAIFKFERITAIRTICESNVYLQNLPQCKGKYFLEQSELQRNISQ